MSSYTKNPNSDQNPASGSKPCLSKEVRGTPVHNGKPPTRRSLEFIRSAAECPPTVKFTNDEGEVQKIPTNTKPNTRFVRTNMAGNKEKMTHFVQLDDDDEDEKQEERNRFQLIHESLGEDFKQTGDELRKAMLRNLNNKHLIDAMMRKIEHLSDIVTTDQHSNESKIMMTRGYLFSMMNELIQMKSNTNGAEKSLETMTTIREEQRLGFIDGIYNVDKPGFESQKRLAQETRNLTFGKPVDDSLSNVMLQNRKRSRDVAMEDMLDKNNSPLKKPSHTKESRPSSLSIEVIPVPDEDDPTIFEQPFDVSAWADCFYRQPAPLTPPPPPPPPAPLNQYTMIKRNDLENVWTPKRV